MSDDNHDKDRVDLTPLYAPPDPDRLHRLARRIAASVAAKRKPRSVMDQLAAWAPAAVGFAMVAAVLAWAPALIASPKPRTSDTAEALLQMALSTPGPGSGQSLWFSP